MNEKKDKKLLIIGSEGFLGTVLVKKLIQSKNFENITGVDTCIFGKFNNKYKNFKLIKKNYKDLSKTFLKNFRYIIDLANVSNDPASELNPKFTIKNNFTEKKKFIKNYKMSKVYLCILLFCLW